jgi:hypothetical protein
MVDTALQSLLRLTASSVAAMSCKLAELAERRAAGEDIPVIGVVLQLSNGREIDGSILSVDNSEGTAMLLLRNTSSNFINFSGDLSYIPLSNIICITIKSAEKMLHLLPARDGAVIFSGGPPSRLELKRKAVQLAEAVTQACGAAITCEIDWQSIGGEGESLRFLAELLSRTTGVLVTLANDDFARREISGQLHAICFKQNHEFRLVLSAGTLTVSANFEQGSDGLPERVALSESIQDLF